MTTETNQTNQETQYLWCSYSGPQVGYENEYPIQWIFEGVSEYSKNAVLKIVDIEESPSVTTEFPNGAHTAQVAEIKAQRDERNDFWLDVKKNWMRRYGWQEGRP